MPEPKLVELIEAWTARPGDGNSELWHRLNLIPGGVTHRGLHFRAAAEPTEGGAYRGRVVVGHAPRDAAEIDAEA